MAEKAKGWSDLTKKEIERLQRAFEEEKLQLIALKEQKEKQHQEELDRKVAQETVLLERLEQQRLHQEAFLNRQQEDREKETQTWQTEKTNWRKDFNIQDKLVRELKETLEKERLEKEQEKLRVQTRVREMDQEMESLKGALYKEKEDREKLLEVVREELQQKLVEKDEIMKEMTEYFQEELRQQREFHKKCSKKEPTDEEHPELENRSIMEGEKVKKNVHFSCDVDKSVDRRSKGSQTPDLEWDYGYRLLQGGASNHIYGRQGGKFSSTPVEDADYFMPIFEESEVPNEYYCQNCQLTHQPPICPCPICLESGHTVIDCQQAGLLESS